MPRRIVLAIAAVVAGAALAAAPASANHIPGATYTGQAAGGGTVSFDVSADGSAVTRFQVTDVTTTCGTISSTTSSIPIVNHAFSYTPAMNLRFAGTFPTAQQAQGTLSFKVVYPSCTSADVGWTATTTAQLPPPPAQCADGADNDGDGRIDYPADPGCGSAADGDETDAPATPLVLTLGGPKSQRLGRTGILVTARCSASCTATATGTVSVKGSAKKYALRVTKASIPTGAVKNLRPKLAGSALRAVRKALAKGRRVTAKVKVTARDAAGNARVKYRDVRLHR